jgi:nucleoporin NUP159
MKLTNSRRPPSLDTINRTYRNIDLAISQQAHDVDSLVARVSKLKISPSRAVTPRIGRLPIELKASPGKHSPPVTPNVAATTAAALNAERTAQKLKGALLRVRKEPLLNKQAIGTVAPTIELNSLQKQAVGAGSNAFTTPVLEWGAASPDSKALLRTPKEEDPTFEPTDSPDSSPLPPTQTSMRRRESGPRHGHAKPIKRTGVVNATTSAPSNFSWGPLPTATPKTALPADFKLKAEGSTGGSSLSSSWVTEGFGAKKP